MSVWDYLTVAGAIGVVLAYVVVQIRQAGKGCGGCQGCSGGGCVTPTRKQTSQTQYVKISTIKLKQG
jgi:hypothetical protein